MPRNGAAPNAVVLGLDHMKISTKLGLILVVSLAPWAPAQPLDPRSQGAPVPAPEAALPPELHYVSTFSADGRWALLTSATGRLVTDDLNGALDVFLLELTTGDFTLASVRDAGSSGNGASIAGAMSADASWVVFQSRATNLVFNDTNGTWDVFARDLKAGATLLVSATANGAVSQWLSTGPLISADGRYVLFRSWARDLASGPLLPRENLYRHDLVERRTECVSSGLPGSLGTVLGVSHGLMTSDGQAVALVLSTVQGTVYRDELVWRDLTTGRAARLAEQLPANLTGVPVNGRSVLAVCGKGRSVVFRSELGLGSAGGYALSWYGVEQA